MGVSGRGLRAGAYLKRESQKEFVIHHRVSRFPERGVDLCRGPVTSGKVRLASGEIWRTSGGPLDCS